MKPLSWALLLLPMLASVVAGTVQARTTVPMIDCSGFPCIKAKVGDKSTLSLAIDTGDAHSVIDMTAAKALALQTRPFIGANGKAVPGYWQAMIPTMAIGATRLSNLDVLVIDTRPLIEKGIFPRSDGTLAYVDLKDRVVTLDYRRHSIDLYDAGENVGAPAKPGTITFPTFGRKGPPIVVTTGFAVNGRPVSVQIDSLYAGTMLIYPTSVARLGLATEAAATKIRSFPYTDGGVGMIESRAASLGFAGTTLMTNAPLYFATPEVHTPDAMFDGTVGAELFADRVLTFDFRRNLFWMN